MTFRDLLAFVKKQQRLLAGTDCDDDECLAREWAAQIERWARQNGDRPASMVSCVFMVPRVIHQQAERAALGTMTLTGANVTVKAWDDETVKIIPGWRSEPRAPTEARMEDRAGIL